jgi:GH18 family chitinase
MLIFKYTLKQDKMLKKRSVLKAPYYVVVRLSNGAPSNKIVLGWSTYGRAWAMTDESDINGTTPVTVDGPAAPGANTYQNRRTSELPTPKSVIYTQRSAKRQNPEDLPSQEHRRPLQT